MDFIGNIGAWTGWSTFFYLVVPFLFVLTIIVFVHEFGHFLVARWCGVRVMVFSLGFGRELVGFTDRHGTRWKISAIPLGGYVKFFGDENAASVPNRASVGAMSEAERQQSFFHKPLAARAAIVAAGPIANFILAVGIFAVVSMLYGKVVTSARVHEVQPGSAAAAAGFKPDDFILAIDGRPTRNFADVENIVRESPGRTLEIDVLRDGLPVQLQARTVPEDEKDSAGNTRRVGSLGLKQSVRIDEVRPSSAAQAAGFEPGDIVLSIDGRPINSFYDMQRVVSASPDRPLEFAIERGGARKELRAVPALKQERDRSGAMQSIGVLGVTQMPAAADVKVDKVGPIAAIGLGARETWGIVDITFTYLSRLVSGRESADQVGGPFGIAVMSGEAAKRGMNFLFQWIAAISVSIGLLNLFPIPLLDGGHLLFYGFEAARGRPLSDRAQEIGFRIGFAIVLMLLVFATYNDILHRIL